MAGRESIAGKINESIIAWASRRVLVKKLAALQEKYPMGTELTELAVTGALTYGLLATGFVLPAALPLILWYYINEGAHRVNGHGSPAPTHA